MKNMTLCEVYDFAKSKGFNKNDVEIEDTGNVYEVSFGDYWATTYVFIFDELTEKSINAIIEEIEE